MNEDLSEPVAAEEGANLEAVEDHGPQEGLVEQEEEAEVGGEPSQQSVAEEKPQTEAPPVEQDEAVNKQVRMFEKYLEETGLTLAFQTIFAEILTKKIEPANVFTYTSMRLREIGREIAHLLPKNLTANLTES